MAEQPTTPNEYNDSALAVELWAGVEENESSSLVALPRATVVSTIERYEGNEVGAAMAANVTLALLPELAIDGTISEDEAEIVDDLVEILAKNGLVGLDIDLLATTLQVDFSLGGLHGLSRIIEMLTDEEDSAQLIFALRSEFGSSQLEDEFEEFESRAEVERRMYDEYTDRLEAEDPEVLRRSIQGLYIADSDDDDSEEAYASEDDHDTDELIDEFATTVTDESGQEFTI